MEGIIKYSKYHIINFVIIYSVNNIQCFKIFSKFQTWITWVLLITNQPLNFYLNWWIDNVHPGLSLTFGEHFYQPRSIPSWVNECFYLITFQLSLKLISIFNPVANCPPVLYTCFITFSFSPRRLWTEQLSLWELQTENALWLPGICSTRTVLAWRGIWLRNRHLESVSFQLVYHAS